MNRGNVNSTQSSPFPYLLALPLSMIFVSGSGSHPSFPLHVRSFIVSFAFLLLGLVLVTDSTCSLACWLVIFHPPTIPFFFYPHLPGYPLSRIDCFELRGDSASFSVAAPLVRHPSLVLPCSHYVTLGNHSVNVQWGHPSFNWHVQLPCSTPYG